MKIKHKSIDLFSHGKSCVDGSIGLILILNMRTEDDGSPRYTAGNIAHEFVCRLWYSKVIVSSAMDMSALAVLMLNFERYLAIVHPIHHRTKFSASRRLSLIMITFTVCLTVTYRFSFGILTCRILSDGRCAAFIERISPTYQMFMGISTFLLNYVIPLTFTVFFYISMALKLHEKIAPDQRKISEVSSVVSLNVSNISEENNSEKDEKQTGNFDLVKARNNILKTSMLLSISFVICWSTNQFYRFLYYFAVIPLGGFLPLYYFSVIMVFANSCFNPFIYCLKYKPFQQSVKTICLYLIKKIRMS